MAMTSTNTDPPIVEFVLGVQFSPLTEFTSAHFGRFWEILLSKHGQWTTSRDAPAIDDQFEQFNVPLWQTGSQMQFQIGAAQPGRVLIENQNRDRMIQLQSTRFHVNWRKTEGQKPRYGTLVSEFEELFNTFCEFCRNSGLGHVTPNQWEITSIDSFPQGEYWREVTDWHQVLPGLFADLSEVMTPGLVLARRRAEWSFDLKDQVGRLHINTNAGRHEEVQTLLLALTCRGPVEAEKARTVREGLDIGKMAMLDAFLRITPQALQERWNIGNESVR